MVMDILQVISIGIEAVIAVLGILLAVKKKKLWGWAIALTFGIYVFYDVAKLLECAACPDFLRGIFFVASLSILWAVWRVFKEA